MNEMMWRKVLAQDKNTWLKKWVSSIQQTWPRLIENYLETYLPYSTSRNNRNHNVSKHQDDGEFRPAHPSSSAEHQ
jgi:hypothetical protein